LLSKYYTNRNKLRIIRAGIQHRIEKIFDEKEKNVDKTPIWNLKYQQKEKGA
jgi:hypothetical protein